MRAARPGRRSRFDYWPGFVDATVNLLLVVAFLLSLFVASEFVLSREVGSQDNVIVQLRSRLAALADLLALQEEENASLQQELAGLTDTLAGERTERRRLAGLLEAESGEESEVVRLREALDEEQRISAEALAQAALLNQQIAAMRRQLRSLQEALEASEARDLESQAQIAELGRRLNTALAQKVQELSRYRSGFLAALRKILSQREGFEIVGDRFILQSEVLFESGEAQINARGRWELRKVAEALKEVSREIPENVAWVLRIDGHTDASPIRAGTALAKKYPSNWHLSAARALAVVEFLVEQGIAPERLVAAGFGEYRPLDAGRSAEAYRRNRRIEFKLTES